MSTDEILKAIEYTRDFMPEDKRIYVQKLLLQLSNAAEKEKLLAERLAEKEKQVASLEADKKNLEADKKNLDTYSKVFIQDKDKLEGDVLSLKGQLHVTEAMRPLVEILSKMAFPSSTSATQSVQLLCANLIQGSQTSSGKVVFGNSLVQRAQTWLKDLEIQPVDPKNVVNELKDLYHELSKNHHYVDTTKTTLSSGLICGGKLPLRAAVALVILEAQRLLANTPGTLPQEDIYYVDENGVKLHILSKSTVV